MRVKGLKPLQGHGSWLMYEVVLRAWPHLLVLGRDCVVTVLAENPGAGFGAVAVLGPGPCRGAAPGGDVPGRPGLSSGFPSMPR